MPPARPRIRQKRYQQDAEKEPTTLWTPLIVVGIIFVIVVLQVKSNWANFRAEVAGQRNRKLGIDAGSHDITLEDQARLEQVLRARVGDVDLRALTESCGIDDSRFDIESLDATCTHYPVEPRVYILGERHSGSNIAAALAYSNFDLLLEPVSSVRKVSPPGINIDETVRKEFGINKHKHNLQDDVGSYGGLSILAVRNVFDWIRAMHGVCYFCDTSNMKRDVSQFISAPWTSGAHIERAYKDIFDLRKSKICAWLEVASTRTNCVAIVRAEELVLPSTQRSFVAKLHTMTGWEYIGGDERSIRTGGTQNVGRSVDERFDAQRYFTDNVLFGSHADTELIQKIRPGVDIAFERALGYKM